MADFTRPEYKHEIDMSAVGGIILDDSRGDSKTLNMDEQPDIVHAALTAVESMKIPNASISAYEHDGKIRIGLEVNAITPGGNGVGLIDEAVKLNGATTHEIGNYIDITPQEGGGYDVSIRVDHAGSYDGTIDAATTVITYDVDAEGNFSDRQGYANAHGMGRITDTEHGVWTVEAIQTLENTFATVLGGNAQEQIQEQRRDGSATSVGLPPVAESMIPLSSIDFEALANGAAPAEPNANLDNTLSAPGQ